MKVVGLYSLREICSKGNGVGGSSPTYLQCLEEEWRYIVPINFVQLSLRTRVTTCKGQNVAYRGKSELPASQVAMALHFAILTITNIRPDI